MPSVRLRHASSNFFGMGALACRYDTVRCGASAWAAEQGVEAADEEILAFLEGMADEQELDDDELDKVAGGGYGTYLLSMGKAATGGEKVLLMAEADTATAPAARPGTYLIQREHANLVAPYLASVGEAHRIASWEQYCAQLPKGWATTYVGLFPGRPDGLLRVNAHPVQAGAAGLDEAMEQLGLAADDAALELCHRLLECAYHGFDLQLNVDERGCPSPDFGFEVYFEDSSSLAKPWEDGQAKQVFGLLESYGVADGRWQCLADVQVSKRASLPVAGTMRPCAFSLRPFSAKVAYAAGAPHRAKAYLRGDAWV